jgi:hypothetical protein
MKLSKHLKALVLVFAAGSFAFPGVAQAYDDDRDAGAEVLGIIGEVISGAIAAKEARERDREFDRYCRRLNRRCDDGIYPACRRYERECE